MPKFKEKPCQGCGEMFEPKSGRQAYCTPECKKAHPVEDHSGSPERSRRGREQAKVEEERATDAAGLIDAAGRQAIERALEQAPLGEQQFLQRIRAVGEAKRNEEWPILESALIDLAACALAWASRIDFSEGIAPLPGVKVKLHEPRLAEPSANGNGNGNGNGHRSVPDRYADLLLDVAGRDLEGAEARATIERLIGVGL